VTRSKLNGLVGLLYEHYGRSAVGVKRSLIWSCVLCVTADFTSGLSHFYLFSLFPINPFRQVEK
jgi:hypothetical protein